LHESLAFVLTASRQHTTCFHYALIDDTKQNGAHV